MTVAFITSIGPFMLRLWAYGHIPTIWNTDATVQCLPEAGDPHNGRSHV